MIDDVIFTKHTGYQVGLNTNEIPFLRFVVEVDIRSDMQERAADHGADWGMTLMGTSRIEVNGDLFGLDSTDFNTKRRNIMRAVMPTFPIQRGPLGTLDMQLTGYTERVLSTVTLAASPVLPAEAGAPARTSFQIQWKSADPRFYGATLNDTGSFSGNQQVTNAGNGPSPPVVVLNGNGVATLGDYSVHIEGAPSGATTLDFANKTVRGPSGQDRYNFFRGDWWQIPEGQHTINISGTSGSVKYRNAYLLIV